MKRIATIFWLLLLSSLALHAQTTFGGKPLYTISVTRGGVPLGDITIELYPAVAPKHVRNFDSLVSIGFYNGTAFHRVVPGFVIQGGDPNSRNKPDSTWGQGDPSQRRIDAEFNPISHVRGVISQARSNDINSATSQFFICVGSPTYLDGRYTAYGRVLTGMSVVDTIVQSPRDTNDRPLQKVVMQIVRTGLDTTSLSTPNLVSPADDLRRVGSGQTLQWSPVDGTVVYEVQVSRDSTFGTLHARGVVATTTFSVTGLQPGVRDYYWRVRANNGGRLGEWSAVNSFTTNLAPVTLVSPAPGDTTLPLVPTFDWNPVDGATSYKLQISSALGFTQATIVSEQTGLTTTEATVSGLEPGRRYYWRVIPVGADGDGPSSTRPFFMIAVPSSVADRGEVAAVTMEIRPNPAREAMTLELRLDRASDVALVLVASDGREVRRLQLGRRSAGIHSIELDLRDLPRGVYHCRVDAGTVVTRSVVVE